MDQAGVGAERAREWPGIGSVKNAKHEPPRRRTCNRPDRLALVADGSYPTGA
jgi:hypothetical protein